MRNPTYSYCQEVLPPSTVDKAVSLRFTGPRASNLALARGNVLEMYGIELVMKKRKPTTDDNEGEVPGDDYTYRGMDAEEFDLPMIRDNAQGRNARAEEGDKAKESIQQQQPQMHLVGRWRLHGKIVDMQRVANNNKADRLLLSFNEAKLSLIAYDPEVQNIVTESIHFYEHEELMQTTFNDGMTCNLRMDPEGRCVAMRIYNDQLAILPLVSAADTELSTNGVSKSYTDSYIIDMHSRRINIHHIRDFVFLKGYLEPTLVLLYEQEPFCSGMLERTCDTCSTAVVSLDLVRRSASVLNTAHHLPYDCQGLVAVPDPMGGVLVLAPSLVAHVSDGTISCITVLNSLAVGGIGAKMLTYIDRTHEKLGCLLEPDHCRCEMIEPNTAILWTQQGYVFLLRLDGDGRLVKRILVEQVHGADPNKGPQGPVVSDWDDIGLLPSCLTKVLSPDDEQGDKINSQIYFVGGSAGRSLLLGIDKANSHKQKNGIVASGDKGSKTDDLADIDAELYGDPPISSHKNNSSKNMDKWSDQYQLTVYDELLGTGSISGMDAGPVSTEAESENELSLVTSSGNEWRGCLRIQQRHVYPEPLATFELPGKPVQRVWTVRCLKEYNIGGVMQATTDNVQLADLADRFMILSREGSTTVLEMGDGLQELERSGFFVDGVTVEVGEILGCSRIVQVYRQGLRLVNAAGRETQSIRFGEGQEAVSAEVSDPYILVRTTNDAFIIFEANSETNKVNKVTTPEILQGTRITSVSFFEDEYKVLRNNKEWVDQNPNMLNQQLHAATSKAGDDMVDDFYSKDKQQQQQARGGDLYEEELGGGVVDSKKRSNNADTRTEGIRGEIPQYLVVLFGNGNLAILQLPNYNCVWVAMRFDSLGDTLCAGKIPEPGLLWTIATEPREERRNAGGDGGSSDDEEHDHSNQKTSSEVLLDQARLVRLGSHNQMSAVHLVAISHSGEVVVYRAFGCCSSEYINQRKGSSDETCDGDDALALRFARMPHDMFVYEPDYEEKLPVEEGPSMDVDTPTTPTDGVLPRRKLIMLNNVGGHRTLFAAGAKCMMVLAGQRRYARVHPVRFSGNNSRIMGVARFHSKSCQNGFVALSQKGALTIGMLPASAQDVSGGIELDSPWPLRCIPVGTLHAGISPLGGVAYHSASSCYVVAAASVQKFGIREPNPDIATRQAREAAEAAEAAEAKDPSTEGKRPRDELALVPEYERVSLQTTSTPPWVPRHHISLLSPATWETIDTYSLAADEHIVTMKMLELETEQAAGGRRMVLCVGTGYVLGEDVASRGSVYIFDVVDIVPLPGRPQANRKLKLLCREETRGTVSALAELRGNLVVTEGSKLYVRSFATGDHLVSVAFLDCQSWMRSLSTFNGFLMIGDLVNSLWFCAFQEERPTRVHILSRDFYNQLSVEHADFLVQGPQMQLLAADSNGALHLFVYAPRDTQSLGGQRLLRRGEFNLRSRVTAIKRMASPPSAQPGLQRHVCLVATESGSVQAVSMVPEKSFKRLYRITSHLVHAVAPPAALNPREYRSVPLRQRQFHQPRRTVLDGDLLVPLYANGPIPRQQEAAQRDGTAPDRVLRDIADTQQGFAFF